MKSTTTDELRKITEARLKDKGTPEAALSVEDTQKLLHELQVHQIELEVQNEELHEARDSEDRALYRYTELFDFAPIGYFILDHSSKITLVNFRGASLLGLERLNLTGQKFLSHVPHEHRATFSDCLAKVFETDGKQNCEISVQVGKQTLWLSLEANIGVADTDCLVVVSDITKLRQEEEALHASEQQISLILNSLSDLVWLKNNKGVYLNCNPMFERFFGASKTEIIGKTDYDFVDAEIADSFRQHDIKAMEVDHPLINEKWITFADGGHSALMETTKTALKKEDGTIVGVLGIGHDITARKKSENTNRTMAITDSLTGLANRAQFEQRLLQSIELAKRENKPLALMMLDLDKFKPVNDTYGHPVGDVVLRAVATTLTKLTRETDVVARFGGDEFAILVVHPEGKVGVVQSAQRIINEIRKPMLVEGHDITIGISIGISLYPEDANTESELIKNSDLALYEVKEQGRGSFLFYQPKMNT
jgi:diguanylate cyclase (GGDEF)-like protein/PAS domain S-box-containing protein